MPDPTILVGSLNDEELKKSIDSLVRHVETQTQAMVTAFDKAVGQINEKVKSLGSTGASSGGVVDSSKLANSVSKLSEALGKFSQQEREATAHTERETNRRIESYDKEVMALKTAIRERIRATENTFITQPSRFGSDLVFYDKDILGSYQQAIDRATELYAAKMRNVEVTRREAEAQAQLNQELGNAKIPYANESGKGGVNDQAAASNAYLKSLREQEEALKRNEQAENELRKSHNALSASLKKLVADYDKMNAAERNSAKGRDLIKKIQATERAIKDIQRQKNRPLRLEDIIAIQPKNLDEIAYKIQQLKAYMQGVDIEGNKSALTFKTIREEIARLQKQQDELMGSTRGLIAQYGAFGRAISYIKNRLAFMLTVGASLNFAKEVYKIRGQYELLERSIGILFDSMSKGKQIFAELNAMAIKSPFTTMELGAAAKQLSAYNIAARDVVDTTRRLADMAAAVGVPIERLTYALGQVKAYGFLNSRDARMFSNAGIPLVQELANRYSELEGHMVSVADVYDRIKNHQVSFEDTLGTINKMTDEGGKFFDFQAKAADTMIVQLANLRLAYNNMLNEMGRSNQTMITAPIKAAKVLMQNWREIDRLVWDVVAAYGAMKGLKIAGLFLIKTNTAKEFLEIYRTTHKWLSLQTGLVAMKGVFRGIGVAISGIVKAARLAAVALAKLWPLLVIGAIVDGIQYLIDRQRQIKELNEGIAESAKEAAASMKRFLNRADVKTLRENLSKGFTQLSEDELNKAWEGIREEIEKSSSASDVFISKLLAEEDLTKRVSEGLRISEEIEKARRALQEVENFSPHQDSWLWGAFGEGITEDFEDLAERIEKGEVTIFDAKEAKKEAKRFAEEVAKQVAESGLSSKEAITEFVNGLRAEFIAQSPKLRGLTAKLFNVGVDEALSVQLNGMYDKTTSMWSIIMTEINKISADAFSGISSDALDVMHKWSPKQEAVMMQAIENIKKKWPREFTSVLDEMEKNLNSREWKMNIVMRFGSEDIFKSEYDVLSEWDKKAEDAAKRIERLTERIDELNKKFSTTVGLTKEEERELSKAGRERSEAQKALDEALAHGGRLKDKKSKNSQKDAVLEALKTEIDLIKKAQKAYDDLIKKGASADEAEITVFSAYSKTLNALNRNLQGFGLPTVKLPDIIGKNPQQMLKYFETLRDLLESKGLGNLERMKVVEVLIEELKVKAQEFNIEQVTKGLNNALSQVKDEYELAVALDADPEIGNAIAQMLGVNIDALPRTFSEALKKVQFMIDDELDKAGVLQDVNAADLLDIKKFNEQLTSLGTTVDTELGQKLKAFRDWLVKLFTDESKAQVAEWRKLEEKYAEFETKITRIHDDAAKQRRTFVMQFGTDEQKEQAVQLETQIQAEKDPKKKDELITQLRALTTEIAGTDAARLNITASIDKSETERIAHEEFEEFQKSSTWIHATGDLATMSHKAIDILIDRIKEYKKKAKDLSSKDIEKLSNALKKLHRANRGSETFGALADALAQAKERVENVKKEINEYQTELDALNDKRKRGEELSDAEIAKMADLEEKIKQLKGYLKETGSIAASIIAKMAMSAQQLVQTGISSLASMFEALGDEKTANALKKVDSVLNSMAQWASMIGSASGSGWGALAGAIAGLGIGLVTVLGDIISGNAEITSQVEDSERRVKRLENAYKELEYAIDKAYGTEKVGASQILILAKQMELAELKRQKRLEESRSSKYRDEERIIELKGQIIELRQEIEQTSDEIINDLLGISSVGDAVENLVSSMIEAFKQGEDYMKQYDESFAEMVDNMIMKAIASKVVGDAINKVWDELDKTMKERGEAYTKPMTATGMQLGAIQEGITQGQEQLANWLKVWQEANQVLQGAGGPVEMQKAQEDMAVAERKIHEYELLLEILAAHEPLYEEQLKQLREAQKEAMQITPEDVQSIRDTAAGARDEAQRIFEEMMAAYGITFGEEGKESELSALQQGIQGVSEDTAGALEAYMNSVNQQVYLQSDLLTQIRDAVVSFDHDVQLSIQSQMLLQLQTTYQAIQAMQSMMEGWSTPSGNGIRVELLS